MANTIYNYQYPHNTFTIDQFNDCGSDTVMSYHNLSFIDVNNGIAYDTYNVFSDYIEEIQDEYCIKVVLNDKQMEKYKYRPKLLCWDIYRNTELAFIILLANDMCSIKQFTKKKLFMPKKEVMNDLIKYLFNANKKSISKYNSKNSK